MQRSSKTIRLSKMIQDVSQRLPAVICSRCSNTRCTSGSSRSMRSKLQLLQHQGQAPQRFQVAHRCRGNLCHFHSMAQQWPEKCADFGRATKGMVELADDIPLLLFASAKFGTGFIPQTIVCIRSKMKFHDVSLFMMIMKQLYFMMRSFMGLPKNTIVYHDWSPTTIYWAPLLDKPTWQVIDSERCAEPLAELKSFCREHRHFHTDLPKRRKRVVSNLGTKKTSQMTQIFIIIHTIVMEVRPIPMVADVS